MTIPCLLSLMLPWQPFFDKRLFVQNFEVHFTFLDHFRVSSIHFGHFLITFRGFWRFWKNPRWPPFANKTLFWRHMSSSANVVDFKGNDFGRTLCSSSFVFIASILSELRCGRRIPPHPAPVPEAQEKPGLNSINSLVAKATFYLQFHRKYKLTYCMYSLYLQPM